MSWQWSWSEPLYYTACLPMRICRSAFLSWRQSLLRWWRWSELSAAETCGHLFFCRQRIWQRFPYYLLKERQRCTARRSFYPFSVAMGHCYLPMVSGALRDALDGACTVRYAWECVVLQWQCLWWSPGTSAWIWQNGSILTGRNTRQRWRLWTKLPWIWNGILTLPSRWYSRAIMRSLTALFRMPMWGMEQRLMQRWNGSRTGSIRIC